MHWMSEVELACFKKLFLRTAPVNRDHPGLATLLDRSWATCDDDGRVTITKDGADVARFSVGWEAADPCAR